MKTRVLLISFLLLLAAAPFVRAQYLPDWEPGDLKKKGTKIAVRGEKLDKAMTYQLLEEVGGTEMVDDWKHNGRLRGWGMGLAIGGSAVAATGFVFGGAYLLGGIVATIFVAPFGQDAVDDLWDEINDKVGAWSYVSLGGFATGVTGIVLWAVGNQRLKKTVSYMNSLGQEQEVELVLGPVASDRIGVAFRF